VVLTPTSVTGGATGGGQFSVNGQRTTSNYFTVDGDSANTGMSLDGPPGPSGSGQTAGTTALGGTNSLVSLDALQEFRIETSTFAAEFGRTPGGQVSLLTRSGTNQFHGSASYYFRNEALDANDWFANSRRLPKPKERQSLFGGVFGGPIRRDRFFFFASYEALRLKQPQVNVQAVPAVDLRRQAVPTLRPYLNALPLPNGRDLGNGAAEFAASYSDPSTFNIFALRLDGSVTKSLTGFFRVSHAPSEAQTRSDSLSTLSNLQAWNNAYTGGITWVARSNLTADLRLNWTRNKVQSRKELESFGGAVVPAVSDIFAPGREPSTSYLDFGDPNGGSFEWGLERLNVQRQFNAVGTIAWLIGGHQLKLGMDYRRMLPVFGGGDGTFEVLQIFTTQDVIDGSASFYQLGVFDPIPRKGVFPNLSLFVQDTWHATRRLTLSYGLRFERVPPPREANERVPRTLLGIENSVLQSPRLAPEGTPLFRSRFGSFAPRLGVAYQVGTRAGWETTLRGGAGIFYDLGLGNIASSFETTFPFFASKTVSDVPLPLDVNVRTPPTLGVDPPDQLRALDPNLRLPYTVEWNATWEQGIGQAQTATVSYVGASGHRLLMERDYFQPLADWPTSDVALFIIRNLGQSSYRALQLQYNRRLRRGVQALASYTFSSSRDNASVDGGLISPAGVVAPIAPSDFDVRHVLSAALTYEVPNLSGPSLPRAVFQDWGLDLLIRHQSAFPISPTAGSAFVNGVFFIRRPDLVPGQTLYIDDPTVPGGRRFNRAAFIRPALGEQGNFPRNGLRGLPASQVDLAIRREFRLSERVRLQFRGELFNLFNHPNFGVFVPSITSGLFGQPTRMLNRSLGGLNSLYQIGGPRSGQMALKITF
jgi:hypothetical protein